jgi:glutamine synthetase
MVAEEGAGFAGFAISGMGMEPHGPDFMARGDLSTLTPVPWQPGYGRVVCVGHVDGKPSLRQPLRAAAAGQRLATRAGRSTPAWSPNST